MKNVGSRCVLLAVLLLWPASIPAADPVGTKRILLPSGNTITAEVADTPSMRLRGLMFRDELHPDHGMLLVFESEDYHGIWMKNCRFPLDILWLDRNRRVVYTEENAVPCEEIFCRTFYPARKALYVLEINAGLISREKLKVGARLDF